jgi:transposase-like protein
MTCPTCGLLCKKYGKDRHGYQRYRCRQCGHIYTEPHNGHVFGMYTSMEQAGTILRLMMEGLSVRSIERLTGMHRDTILKVLVQTGSYCEHFLAVMIRDVPVKQVQCDELWGFVWCKEKNNREQLEQRGDAYCFVAIERGSKLILTWHLGRRTADDTVLFTEKLEQATTGRFQLTTDGFAAYREAVHYSLGTRVDFAQLVKVYAVPRDADQRYSPSQRGQYHSPAALGHPRSPADLYLTRRTPKFKHAHATSEADPAYQCLLKKEGQFEGGSCNLFCLLQFYEGSPELTDYSSHGVSADRSCVVVGRVTRVCHLAGNAQRGFNAIKRSLTTWRKSPHSEYVGYALRSAWLRQPFSPEGSRKLARMTHDYEKIRQKISRRYRHE